MIAGAGKPALQNAAYRLAWKSPELTHPSAGERTTWLIPSSRMSHVAKELFAG